jgi:hypothetical protein
MLNWFHETFLNTRPDTVRANVTQPAVLRRVNVIIAAIKEEPSGVTAS